MTISGRELHGISLLAAGFLLAGLCLPFVSYAPNRVAEYELFYTWQAASSAGTAILILGLLGPLVGIFRRGSAIEFLIPGLVTAAALTVLALSDSLIPAEATGTARLGGGPGFWVWILTAYLYSATSSRSSRSLIIPVLIIALFLFGGLLDHLGPVREFAIKKERFLAETGAHLWLSVSATLIAALAAIPAGIAAYRNRLFSRFAFTGANIVQTLPSLALFGLMIAPLAWISARFPLLRELGVKGVGNFPALIALSGYCALPILRNTYTGLEVIPEGAVQAGRGMGMSPVKLLTIVEVPLALPVILGGIRIAFVQAIGNTTVAALIGAGGLGNFVFQGLGQAAPDLILLGVVPLIALAVAADGGLKLLEHLITPKPFREA